MPPSSFDFALLVWPIDFPCGTTYYSYSRESDSLISVKAVQAGEKKALRLVKREGGAQFRKWTLWALLGPMPNPALLVSATQLLPMAYGLPGKKRACPSPTCLGCQASAPRIALISIRSV